jgi:hypothetical protein
MLPISNPNFKTSAKVSPIDEDKDIQPALVSTLEQPENTNITLPINNDPMESTQDARKIDLIYKLFTKKSDVIDKVQPATEAKQDQGFKLKRFEIVCMIYLYLKVIVRLPHSDNTEMCAIDYIMYHISLSILTV